MPVKGVRYNSVDLKYVDSGSCVCFLVCVCVCDGVLPVVVLPMCVVGVMYCLCMCGWRGIRLCCLRVVITGGMRRRLHIVCVCSSLVNIAYATASVCIS